MNEDMTVGKLIRLLSKHGNPDHKVVIYNHDLVVMSSSTQEEWGLTLPTSPYEKKD